MGQVCGADHPLLLHAHVHKHTHARARTHTHTLIHPPDCATSGGGFARIVSADHFFEQGAGVMSRKERKGLSVEEIYARSFDPALVGQAHDYCRAMFREALDEGT